MVRRKRSREGGCTFASVYDLIHYGFEQKAALQFYEDPHAVIAMEDNPVNRKGSRQIDTGKHLLFQKNAYKIIIITWKYTKRIILTVETRDYISTSYSYLFRFAVTFS